MADRVVCTIADGVADVRLNRPEKLNALDMALFTALADTAAALRRNARRARRRALRRGPVVLRRAWTSRRSPRWRRGSGGARADDPTTTGADGRSLGQRAVLAWYDLPVPVIAAVRGHALGGGLQLALGADIRLAAPDAVFSVFEINWGLTPDMAGTQLLPRLVGPDLAAELTYTGRMVEAAEADRDRAGHPHRRRPARRRAHARRTDRRGQPGRHPREQGAPAAGARTRSRTASPPSARSMARIMGSPEPAGGRRGGPGEAGAEVHMTAEVETTSAVLVETDAEGVCTLTFNRPERRNGWAGDLEDAYYAALTDAARDPAVRAVVVTGAGPTFCPGADMARLGDLSADGASLPHRPVDVPRTFPKPLIAAINGACAGVGLVQALFCHVRFAADSARFSTAFARRGLVAEYGIAWTLPRLVGLENALDLLLSGRTFDASEAKALGLVSRVVARVDVLAAAQAYARDIAENCAPAAVAVIAAQVFDAADGTYADALARAHVETDKRIGSADLREGVASWLEKRAPQFGRCPGRASDVPRWR